MKMSEIREFGSEEALAKLRELKAELGKELAQVASGTRPENPGKIRSLKKAIARILTSVNEKKLGINAKKAEEKKGGKEIAEKAGKGKSAEAAKEKPAEKKGTGNKESAETGKKEAAKAVALKPAKAEKEKEKKQKNPR
jgi:large subunit ribosomal protein L29